MNPNPARDLEIFAKEINGELVAADLAPESKASLPVDLGARCAVPAGNGKLIPHLGSRVFITFEAAAAWRAEREAATAAEEATE